MAVHSQLAGDSTTPQSRARDENQNPARPITLRRATPTDAPSICQIGAHTFTTTFGHSLAPSDLQAYLDSSYSLEATTQDILDPNKDMLVATTPAAPSLSQSSNSSSSSSPDGETSGQDTTLGFALLTRGSTEPCLSSYAPATLIELQRLYVHPAHQGRGAGNLLARELESMARRQGYKYMWLGVWEENVKAQRVYERMGYTRVGEHAFAMGEEVQTDWVLVKEL